jgi:hypothetical protein
MFQPSQIAAFKVTVSAPEEGKTYDAAGIEALVTNGLDEFKLRLAEISPGRYGIVQVTEALSYLPIVTVEQLGQVPDSKWVTLAYRARIVQARIQRETLSNLMVGESVVGSIEPYTLLLCDRADRLRKIVPILDEIEKAASLREVRLYEAPPGVEAGALSKALADLIPKDRYVPVSAVTQLSGTRLFVVHAVLEQQSMVADALKKLAALATPPASEKRPELHRYEIPAAASVEESVAALEKLFRSVGQGRPTFAAVPGAHAIVARAYPIDHEAIAKFVELIK